MNTALAKRSGLLGSAVMLLASVAMGPITPADARITRVVITTTTPPSMARVSARSDRTSNSTEPPMARSTRAIRSMR